MTAVEAEDVAALWRYALKWLPVMATQLNTERIGFVGLHHVFQNSSTKKRELRMAMALNKRHVEEMTMAEIEGKKNRGNF